MQHEITVAGPLLDSQGRLIRKGFSKKPVSEYNPDMVGGAFRRRLRLKEWDYYGITGPNHFFSVTVSNIGYMGLVFSYLIDFGKRIVIAKNTVTPMGSGIALPRTSLKGDVHFRKRLVDVSFERGPEGRTIRVKWGKFHQGDELEASFELSSPAVRESIVMSTPIGDRCFYYNEKIPAMPAKGTVVLGKKTVEFNKQDSFAVLDWGRGVWEYGTFWNWASAQGKLADGRSIGINIGQGFGDLSAASENCFFIDGKMHKLETVKWSYKPGEWLSPWRFQSEDGRVNLTMSPMIDRPESTNLLVLKSSVHQVFGRYSGTLVCDDGEVLQIPGIIGWAEEHRARW